jgi:hypothetical protein
MKESMLTDAQPKLYRNVEFVCLGKKLLGFHIHQDIVYVVLDVVELVRE